MNTQIANKENSLGKELNIIISNGSENQFAQLVASNTPVQVKNALIIAIPQDSEGNDIPKAASLWLSDNAGYLLELSRPISEYNSNSTLSPEYVEALKSEFINVLDTSKANAIESLHTEKEVIKHILDEQYLGLSENINKEVQKAHDKINTINEYLDQNINKIIWTNPNIAYLAHKVRTLCERNNIEYDFDNEYSNTEVLHNEHHALTERIEQLEERINQLTNGGH